MDSVEVGMKRDPRERMDRRSASGRDVLPGAVIECGERFTAALDTMVDRDALQLAVRDFATTVRGHNVPPERALAAFKFMVFNLPALTSKPPDERVALMRDVTQMSIEAYYRAD
jgi:hypothetical protein